jgi:DNA polymerase III epsilon subunit-like protein
MQELLSGVDTWEEAAAVIRGTEIVYFDYETTGLSTTPGDGELNRPVQIGAVRVKDGKVIDRINIYMNPSSDFQLGQVKTLSRRTVKPLQMNG